MCVHACMCACVCACVCACACLRARPSIDAQPVIDLTVARPGPGKRRAEILEEYEQYRRKRAKRELDKQQNQQQPILPPPPPAHAAASAAKHSLPVGCLVTRAHTACVQ